MNMLPAGDGAAQVERWGGQYLIVQLQAESFGVDISAVREIIAYVVPTQIPMMPAFVVGVINLRGQVVPVIDIARRFERPATAIHKRSCIIIVDLQEGESRQRLGVIVDAVNEVLEFPADQIEPAPQFGAGLRTEFIRGMGKVANQFIVLLEMARVLSMDEMAELAAIAAGAS
ncbi:chemotaxis protein CheW [Acidithiobacillus sp.]|jgi:purine-binding chemotaxis protein CheW|uniref:chemotaxis protein CheW n=1 Tax=Acidithiobacillus sp. TaxID=1872118 RepID=UPI0025C1B3D9|nr:chemotaxis protein CheW [Acidithiobacillus sp.]MCK9187636.1 chemotaxis protein CheW [Acidithiobacillus sp.]MCK9358526.1 chemotaxis protein CheW [Acidithiobacillus sp.]